jgi:hypothetical protein
MMVNSMKCRTIAISILLFLLNPAWVLAEHPSVIDKQAEIVEPDKVSSTVEAGTNQAFPGKCKGGRMHGVVSMAKEVTGVVSMAKEAMIRTDR